MKLPSFKEKIIKRAQSNLSSLENCLKWYATSRKDDLLVGQFLDDIGCGEDQYGIFGISCWIVMSNGVNEEKIKKLKLNCEKKLKQWVQELKSGKWHKDDHIHLKENTLKIVFALEALSLADSSDTEYNYLLEQLLSYQKTNGSWDFILNSQNRNGNILVTSIALRCLRNVVRNEDTISKINKSINYLFEDYEKQKNIYERLFILNTIQIIKNNFTYPAINLKENIKDEIKDAVKSSLKAVRLNPTKFPNPINIDYHHKNRTSYFRLPPSSVILLESLILISGRLLPFLNAYVYSAPQL